MQLLHTTLQLGLCAAANDVKHRLLFATWHALQDAIFSRKVCSGLGWLGSGLLVTNDTVADRMLVARL